MYHNDWVNLANTGGGMVNGEFHSKAQCLGKVLHYIPKHAQTWNNFGAVGGGTVEGRYYSKAQCYERSLELDPKHTGPWHDLGIAGGGTVKGQHYSALQCFKEASKYQPFYADSWSVSGNQGGGPVSGKHFSVIECFEMGLNLDSKNPHTWYNLGAAGGGTVEGRKYSKAQCYEQSLTLNPNHVDAMNGLGVEGGGTVKGRKYSKAQCFEQALKSDPRLFDAWHKLGVEGGGTVDGQQYSKLLCFRQALRYAPKHVQAKAGLAQQMQLLEQALKLEPNAGAWNELGVAGGGTVGGRKYSKAQCFEQSLTLNPKEANTWSELGVEGGGTVDGQQYSKLQCFEQALKLDPKDAWANASLLKEQQRLKENQRLTAEKVAKKVANWAFLSNIGGGMMDGQHYSAAQCLEKVLQYEPKHFGAWNNLGTAGGGTVAGQHYSAVQCMEQSLKLDPKHVDAWHNLGVDGGGTVKGQKFSKAQCFEQAIKYDPKHASAWHNLGIEGGGTVEGQKYSKAQCLEQALKLEPKHASAEAGLLEQQRPSAEDTRRNGSVVKEPVAEKDLPLAEQERLKEKVFKLGPKISGDYSEGNSELAAWRFMANMGGGVMDGQRRTRKQCLVKVLQLDPKSAGAWNNLAVAGGGTVEGRHYSKVQCIERSLDLDPKFANTWNDLAVAGGGTVHGQHYSALQCFEEALKYEPKHVLANAGLLQEQQRLKKQRLFAVDPVAAAVKKLRCEASAHRPAMDWANLANSGGGMMDGHSYSKAQSLVRLIELEPMNTGAWDNLGVEGGGTVEGRKYSKAQCFEQALTLNPEHFGAWHKLGVAGGGTVKGRKYSKAQCFEQALKYEPTHADLWLKLGIEGGGTVDGRHYSKLECFQQAQTYDPRQEANTWTLVSKQDKLELTIKEKRANEDKLKHMTADGLKMWYHMGVAGGGTVNGQKYSKAQCFEWALRYDPKKFGAWFRLGVEGGGTVEGAKYSEVQCFEQALKLDRKHGQTWNNLGAAGGGTVEGQHYSAVQCFEQALKYDAKNADAWHHLEEEGGGTVDGQHYSKKRCSAEARKGRLLKEAQIMTKMVNLTMSTISMLPEIERLNSMEKIPMSDGERLQAIKLFLRMDFDHNGVVDADEYIKSTKEFHGTVFRQTTQGVPKMVELSTELKEKAVLKIQDLVLNDIDGDGAGDSEISMQEWIVFVQKHRNQLTNSLLAPDQFALFVEMQNSSISKTQSIPSACGVFRSMTWACTNTATPKATRKRLLVEREASHLERVWNLSKQVTVLKTFFVMDKDHSSSINRVEMITEMERHLLFGRKLSMAANPFSAVAKDNQELIFDALKRMFLTVAPESAALNSSTNVFLAIQEARRTEWIRNRNWRVSQEEWSSFVNGMLDDISAGQKGSAQCRQFVHLVQGFAEKDFADAQRQGPIWAKVLLDQKISDLEDKRDVAWVLWDAEKKTNVTGEAAAMDEGGADVEALKRNPRIMLDHDNVWHRYGVAGGGTVNGQHYSRKQCFEQALKIVPNNGHASAALRYTTQMEEKMERFMKEGNEQAKVNAEYALGSVLKDPNMWYRLGAAGGGMMEDQHYSKKRSFELALDLNPQHYDAWTNLGAEGGGTVKGHHYSRTRCFEQALEHNLNNPRGSPAIAWYNLGGAGGGMMEGQKYSTVQCFEQALNLDPNQAEAWKNLAGVGGGTVEGKHYTEAQCLQESAEHTSVHHQTAQAEKNQDAENTAKVAAEAESEKRRLRALLEEGTTARIDLLPPEEEKPEEEKTQEERGSLFSWFSWLNAMIFLAVAGFIGYLAAMLSSQRALEKRNQATQDLLAAEDGCRNANRRRKADKQAEFNQEQAAERAARLQEKERELASLRLEEEAQALALAAVQLALREETECFFALEDQVGLSAVIERFKRDHDLKAGDKGIKAAKRLLNQLREREEQRKEAKRCLETAKREASQREKAAKEKERSKQAALAKGEVDRHEAAEVRRREEATEEARRLREKNKEHRERQERLEDRRREEAAKAHAATARKKVEALRLVAAESERLQTQSVLSREAEAAAAAVAAEILEEVRPEREKKEKERKERLEERRRVAEAAVVAAEEIREARRRADVRREQAMRAAYEVERARLELAKARGLNPDRRPIEDQLNEFKAKQMEQERRREEARRAEARNESAKRAEEEAERARLALAKAKGDKKAHAPISPKIEAQFNEFKATQMEQEAAINTAQRQKKKERSWSEKKARKKKSPPQMSEGEQARGVGEEYWRSQHEEAAAGAFSVGDVVTWIKADNDIPAGTTGELMNCEESGGDKRAVVRWNNGFSGNMKLAELRVIFTAGAVEDGGLDFDAIWSQQGEQGRQRLDAAAPFPPLALNLSGGGFVFQCSTKTQAECLERGLLGLPRAFWARVQEIQADTPIFLHNFQTKELHGVFSIVGKPGCPIEEDAWTDCSLPELMPRISKPEMKRSPEMAEMTKLFKKALQGGKTPFPAQVRVRRHLVPRLSGKVCLYAQRIEPCETTPGHLIDLVRCLGLEEHLSQSQHAGAEASPIHGGGTTAAMGASPPSPVAGGSPPILLEPPRWGDSTAEWSQKLPPPDLASSSGDMWGAPPPATSAVESPPAAAGLPDAPPTFVSIEPPDVFLCSITQEMMEDPVMATDGHTYERRAIEQWLATNLTSPKTGTALETSAVFPNHAMRHQILEWREVTGAHV